MLRYLDVNSLLLTITPVEGLLEELKRFKCLFDFLILAKFILNFLNLINQIKTLNSIDKIRCHIHNYETHRQYYSS